jgi:hypothetical protein
MLRKITPLDLFRFGVMALFIVVVVDGFLHSTRKMPSAPVAFQKALDR